MFLYCVILQHRMNQVGLDVQGDETEWNKRNAGKIGSHTSFTLLYNNCDCTTKCTMKINEFYYFKRNMLASRVKQVATDRTYDCPKKSGSGFNVKQIGDFGKEYVKNTVRIFCRNHELPGIISYAFECGPGDLIFGIAHEPDLTKYDIIYIQIQIITKSGTESWQSQNRQSYPDDILGILLNIDKKSDG